MNQLHDTIARQMIRYQAQRLKEKLIVAPQIRNYPQAVLEFDAKCVAQAYLDLTEAIDDDVDADD